MAAATYSMIKNGRGILYASGGNLYKQVKKRGNVKYLKCHIISCDGSAKIQGDEFIAGVSIIMIVMVVALCEDIYISDIFVYRNI